MNQINIINDYNKDLVYNKKLINTVINNLFLDQNASFDKILIILSNKKLLNKLKKDYFKLDQYTDVIVFNLEENNNLIDGEIYISIDDILENSVKYKQTFDLEFKRVLIHGALHLLGYEDGTSVEKNIMRKLENKYIRDNTRNIISINL